MKEMMRTIKEETFDSEGNRLHNSKKEFNVVHLLRGFELFCSALIGIGAALFLGIVGITIIIFWGFLAADKPQFRNLTILILRTLLLSFTFIATMVLQMIFKQIRINIENKRKVEYLEEINKIKDSKKTKKVEV